MQTRGIKFSYFAIAMGVIAIAIGIWLLFFHSSGYVKTTATITSIEENEFSTTDDKSYDVTVEYFADGTRYTELLDSYSGSYKVGKKINVRYDPQNPSKVHSAGLGVGIYLLVIGAALIGWQLVSSRREKDALAMQKESFGETVYAPSTAGPERELYFLTDRGTAKYGHRIEDKDLNVLYEAKVTKFTLSAPTGFEFIDHEHGKSSPHLVGHEENTEHSSIFFDNFSTFTFDGEDIWKHLRRSGISINSEFAEGKVLWPQYRVFRDGEEIALIRSSGMYPHEEDAEKKGRLANAIPARGYFRIRTTQENLDLLFVTALAFARSSALDANGGSYGLIFKNLFRKKNK